MTRMVAVWDRAVEVMRGRASILVSIAFLTVFLPNVISAAVRSFAPVASPGMAAAGGLVAIVAFLVTLFGSLALIAVASDPSVDQPRAFALAGRRFPAVLGLTLLMVLAAILLFVPFGVIFAASGVDMAALGRGQVAGTPSGGAFAAAFLYLSVLVVVFIWVAARLVLFNAVVLNEQRGIGTFARSWELTRGLTWRIVGLLILFALLIGVATIAAQTVTALIARLLLGSSSAAGPVFVGTLFASVVSAGAAIVQSSFLAQLYNAVTGREAATAFE